MSDSSQQLSKPHDEYILVTGGLGYIGRHVCAQLLESNYNVIIVTRSLDNKETIQRVLNTISKSASLKFVISNMNRQSLNNIFSMYKITHVIHLANIKCLADSLSDPLKYYQNNVVILINLLETMKQYHCKNIIYSSSATVYGCQQYPVTEESPIGVNITLPYGRTKYFTEQILQDLYNSDHTWTIIILRCFNPISSHSKYNLAENPNEPPNNLFSCILNTSRGIISELKIYGYTYKTPDGTSIRDFIHVVDVADAHLCTIKSINKSGCYIYNIGTGQGLSVLELVRTFEEITGKKIPYQLCEGREGDLPIIYGTVDKIKNEIGWSAKKTYIDMCKDVSKHNPPNLF
jgi:UDP-glucose 4-epimerase